MVPSAAMPSTVIPLVVAASIVLMPQSRASGFEKAAAVYQQRVHETGIVGSSLMFVKDGIVAVKAFEGYQDLETKRPVDEDTIYHWASITKTFTGVAIMQLRDRGLLSLDDPAIKYVPELREVHNPYGDMSQVTIRHLMTHSYVRTDKGLQEQRFDLDTGITVSNGGLNAPLGDMARWLAFLIGSSSDARMLATWSALLKRLSVEEMFTPQIRAIDGEGGSG